MGSIITRTLRTAVALACYSFGKKLISLGILALLIDLESTILTLLLGTQIQACLLLDIS